MHLRLLMLVVALFLCSPARADVFLLGDVTPIFDLTVMPPHELEREGNQELFMRFLGNSELPRVAIRSTEFFARHAENEISYFYGTNNVPVDILKKIDQSVLEGVDLLVLGAPDWAWTSEQVSAIRNLLARGGNLLIVVEPGPGKDSATQLLTYLNSSLSIESTKGCCGGRQWAMLADHPLMRGIGPVGYGATHTVGGRTPLMYHKEGESMLSVEATEISTPTYR